MTIQSSYENVEFLIPPRFRRAQRDQVAALVAELTATIAALPTASSASAIDHPDTFKAWASQTICDLPTLSNGDNDHGTS